jgi:hypothetical protein
MAFRSIYRPGGGTYWLDPANPPTPEEAKAWRIWMKDVFMPLHDQLRKAIVEHADLLEESDMPQVLLDYCAHVETYRGVIQQWEGNEFSRHISANLYPPELDEYARTRYKA